MANYTPPLRDMRFVYHELLGCDDLAELPGFEEFTPDLIDPILEEAGKICAEVLQPINRSGDEEGCRLENGVVRTPSGFPEAYRQFREGGWTAITCDPEYGGQGLPAAADVLVTEMICSANLSFGMYPGLSHGAYLALHSHGSDELKQAYLPKLVDGTWSGTMCLTEPHCGTDLGLLRSKALPQEDGSYRITGTKIFISAGEHDLTENIIHLVLARLPDAPKGSRGISLFVVPKFLPTAEGAPGERNGVMCSSIEHKMGIKASSTCVMNFDEAQGWLVGAPHKGLQAMFTMMNNERLAVGGQGLGLAEAAYQGSVAYARERLQGRSLTGTKAPDKPADPIIVHPDVRRMLLLQRAATEGCRAMAVWVAKELDKQTHHPEPEVRKASEDFVALMTPIVKALFTDLGFENANLGMQVLGGHGYIREHGMEQYVRDARITQVYEGTNGIQALDLVGRKLGANGGRYLRRFFHPVSEYIAAQAEVPQMSPYIGPLAKAFGRLQTASATIAQRGLANPDEAGAAATDYLRLFGLTALGYLWARMAETAMAKSRETGDADGYYAAKQVTARFFMEKMLPQTGTLLSQIMAGGQTVMALDEAAF
ncbi:acyl-CoA dehydrogenase C-terminal domain-containing protein [Yangia mangrovi]|uniref:3-methylmercaptopropionyl-CoA dehydrogenase n=1 Tax=Alloyangia mangrovi TaxID=1779329 RepID=A0A2A3JYD9_9RHOB|nr:acyl-CoA dehydrogenase C-terminal domain-containing protein [Alloyangia mangrovi]MCT4368922.1 acyl-CoA dehydrogenase C-terminal domain-containing protein [Alloyangia mangrovi]